MSERKPTMTALVWIALVDDNEYDNEYATIMLRKAGYGGRVDVYESGEQALDAFRSGLLGVDLLLLDINMPGMNGFEFAERLEASKEGAPPPVVVMLTSSPDPAEQHRAARIPVIRGVLIKPLTAPALIELVEHLATTDRMFGHGQAGSDTQQPPETLSGTPAG